MKEVRVEVDALLAGIEDGEFLTVEDLLGEGLGRDDGSHQQLCRSRASRMPLMLLKIFQLSSFGL